MLKDSFERTLDYLRVSITDRCNLRCIYCMPREGVEWKPHENILTFEQIIRIINIFSTLGVKKIRVTGGEPLLRRGVSLFLKELKSISGIESVSLTTNGILLNAYLDEAESAGNAALPDSINISLDSLSFEKYKTITRCKNTDVTSAPDRSILPAIDRLIKKNITVKINCVPVRGVNEDEILPLASLAKDKNISVRFIELMPAGPASGLQFIPGGETARLIEKAYGSLTALNRMSGNGPAIYYSLKGFTGRIGFINAVSRGFCDKCNRLRLTSEGYLKLCLSHGTGIDLRKLISAGCSDIDIADAVTKAVYGKPRSHTLSDIYSEPEIHREGLSKIGG